jgi:hypothetical protein
MALLYHSFFITDICHLAMSPVLLLVLFAASDTQSIPTRPTASPPVEMRLRRLLAFRAPPTSATCYLTIAPAFLSASVYPTVSHLITIYYSEYARVQAANLHVCFGQLAPNEIKTFLTCARFDPLV